MGLFNCYGGKCEGGDDQQIADKILTIITNNPEKIKDLKSSAVGNVNMPDFLQISYNFTIGKSQQIISKKRGKGKYDLFVGDHYIKCDSNTSKNIFKSLEKNDPNSRVNTLSSFDESKNSRKPLINEDIQKELSNFNKLVNYTPKK
jgi:hypothetical protein